MQAGKIILENIEKDQAINFITELKDKVDEDGKTYLEDFEKSINYQS